MRTRPGFSSGKTSDGEGRAAVICHRPPRRRTKASASVRRATVGEDSVGGADIRARIHGSPRRAKPNFLRGGGEWGNVAPPMTTRTVLFDLDGTLIEHLPAIHRSYSHTLPQLGLAAPTREQVKRAIGGGLENAMRTFVTEAQLPEALKIYRAHWDVTMLEGASLMPGARELLEALTARGVVCAVFTNKLGGSARAVCAHLGVMPWLRGVYGAQDTAWLKPQVEFARHVMVKLDAKAETTVLVGDSPFDVEAALNAGIGFAGVTTGTHTEGQLRAAGAVAVVADLPALQSSWLG